MTLSGSLADRLQRARQALQRAGQSHVLHFWDHLGEPQRQQLLDQIESVDWTEVSRLIETHVHQRPPFELPADVKPAPWYPYIPGSDLKDKYRAARRLGLDLIRANKVAAFTVAGGQGTRLGWDGPKGTFPATPIRGLPLFGCLAEYLLKLREKHGGRTPWYIMTSPVNDAATRTFFDDQGYFGLDPADVMFFPQGMMPALDSRPGPTLGKVLLEAPDSIALSPNGHGGSLKALQASGAIADMHKRGVEQICYTQIDNPIVRVVDPVFLGLHALDDCQMSSKMLPKCAPMEKLGNFCLANGKMTVIEYSDLPVELAHERLPDGALRFQAGSIAIHVLRVDFVAQLNRQGHLALPVHRADKKVPFVDLATGRTVKPEQANAVKLETFVFDALPLCDRSMVYETDRIDEFAPIKNADTPPGAAGAQPAPDSPESSKQIQTERAARWLEQAGVKVPRDSSGRVAAVLEIRQRTAIEAEDLRSVKLPGEVDRDAKLLL